jgi:hypothetical protein
LLSFPSSEEAVVHGGSGMAIADRFAAYVGELTKVVGHADRAGPPLDYCYGLLATEGRRSVEPMAAVTAPARVSAQHQKLLHFVSNSEWSDEQMLAKVRELVMPSMTRQGPIEAWIIDDTSFPKKGRHSVGGASSVLRTTRQASQLPGGGDAVDRQSSWQFANRLSVVSAAGVDGRQIAARQGACAVVDQVQDQTAACAGADPCGGGGERGSRCRTDGRGLRDEQRSAPGVGDIKQLQAIEAGAALR